MINDNDFNKALERFKLILQTRDFEIEMFWKRCNYFLVLNTALAVGVFASFGGNKAILPFICFAGAFVCYAWFKVGLGSKFWQSHWEQIVEEMQEDIGFRKDGGGDYRKDYFSQEGADVRVERNLFPPNKEHHWLKNLYNKRVMGKPSVSGWMQITAFVFFVAWVLLFFYSAYAAIKQPSPMPEFHKAECSPVGECGASPHKFSPPYGESGNSVLMSTTNSTNDSKIKSTASINR